MIVRLARVYEDDIFVGLARLMLAESYPDHVFSEKQARETFARYLKTAVPTFFFAEDDGRIIGVLQASISAFDFADGLFTTLCGTFVHPDKRGSRAAAMLLAEFTRWSDDHIGAVESTGGNDNALSTERTTRLLGHFGFEPVGTFVRRKRGCGRVKKGR